MGDLPRFRAQRFMPYSPSPGQEQRPLRIRRRFGPGEDETDVDEEENRVESLEPELGLDDDQLQPQLLEEQEDEAEVEEEQRLEERDEPRNEDDVSSTVENNSRHSQDSTTEIPAELASQMEAEVDRIIGELASAHSTSIERLASETVELHKKYTKEQRQEKENPAEEESSDDVDRETFESGLQDILRQNKEDAVAASKEVMKTFVEDLIRRHHRELESIKGKQWCQACRSESRHPCCWNVSYCSRDCQRADWPSHRHFCVRPHPDFASEFIRKTYFTKYERFDDTNAMPAPPLLGFPQQRQRAFPPPGQFF